MFTETSDEIVGHITGRSVPFDRTSNQSRADAIAKVEKVESERRSAIENRLGRPLTRKEIARGTIQHTETRSQRELLDRHITLELHSTPPQNPYRAAAEWQRSQIEGKKMSIRERIAMEAERLADEYDEKLKANTAQAAIMADPNVQKAVESLKGFLVDVNFSPCDVATVERTQELLAKVQSGDLDRWEAVRDEISYAIYEQCHAPGIAQTLEELNRQREVANHWKVVPTEPKPKPSSEPGFTLADIQRMQDAQREEELKKERVEKQSTHQPPADEIDIEAGFDRMEAILKKIGEGFNHE